MPCRQEIASAGKVKTQDLNIPLVFSSHGVDILVDFVVSLVSQQGPDDADHVSSKSTNCLVMGLACRTLAVIVRLRLRYTPVVVGHGCHHGRLAAGVDLAWNPYPANLPGLVG